MLYCLYLSKPQDTVRDTPRPVEQDGLLSYGSTMALFPKEPHERQVAACTTKLRQQRAQALRGVSALLLLPWNIPGCVDTLVQQVFAFCPAPTQEAMVSHTEYFSAAYSGG